jgi:PAS domain S-box-containing protein
MLNNPVEFLRKFVAGLSFKLSFYAGLLVLPVLLVFAYKTVKAQEHDIIDKIIQGAVGNTEVIKAALRFAMMTNDREGIRSVVEAARRGGGFEEVDVFDHEGILRFSGHSSEREGKARDRSDPLLEGIASDPSVRHLISNDGRGLRVVNPFLNTKSCYTAACHHHPKSARVLGALSVELSLAGVREQIDANARRTVTFAVILFLSVSTVIGLLVIFFVDPSLKRLKENAAKMARGEYFPGSPAEGPGEMAELSRSFDEMSRRITERTAHLAERRKMYKSLFEEVPCYLTVVDRDYRIVRANRAFREQFGDQVGKACYVGYKELDAKCPDCPVARTFSDGGSHRSEEEWRLAGERAYVIVNTAPIFDDRGRVTEVLEMSVDVTELKELQEELRRRQEEYGHLFSNVPCYLTVLNESFDIVEANSLFRRDFGDGIGRKCYRVYKGGDSKCDNCPVERTFKDGESHQSEEIWRRNGEESNIIVHTAPLTDDAGRITSVIEMSTNITEVKRLQNELALLGETIAGMSHTIKNILSGLQGGVYVVDSGLERNMDDRVRLGWTMVKKNVEKISDLVQGILYASKERPPEYVQCDPAAILTDVCDLFEAEARAAGIELIRDFDTTPVRGMLDPAGIHGVLTNLVSNALEACRTSPNGDCRVKVVGRVTDGILIMEIIDNGTGIPEEIKERLFGRFYSTKGSRGTGLGLVITKKIVGEHGGKIAVYSEPGRGATFRVEIPFGPVGKDRGPGPAE